MDNNQYDAIIIGSGFGGAMTAIKLVEAGWKVAVIERGNEVKRGPQNWDKNASLDLTQNYDMSQPYDVKKGGNKAKMGVYSALGGPSVYYGGVSFRFREADFHSPEDITGDSGAKWPIDYHDLSPYYDEAEERLQIAGESGADPTEPERKKPFPQGTPPNAEITLRLKNAAQSLGLRPFRMPLAINYEDTSRNICQRCSTCDTFACAIGAKNDIATMILPRLIENSAVIYKNTLAHRLEYHDGLISKVHCTHVQTLEKFTLKADVIILAAGALGSPHLLLHSELEKYNPAGNYIGRFLMRHVNAIIFGIFPTPPDKQKVFHKELAIMDYYFGHESIDYPKNKLGSLQQISTPPAGLVEAEAPKYLGKMASLGVNLLTGLLAIAEDQPQYENHIFVNKDKPTIYGMANPMIVAEYSQRDKAAIIELAKKAKLIMKKTGAWAQYIHHIRTFSHAVGTVRMGADALTAPLDPHCNFRGIDNLFVVDGSFMPTSAAVNPSLTISANALRIGDYLVNTIKKNK